MRNRGFPIPYNKPNGVPRLDSNGNLVTADGLAAVGSVTQSSSPTVNDDSGDGYEVGSIWIDSSTSPATVYKCLDATEGAAVWREVVLLNADGELVGPIIVRTGTTAELDALTLESGEIAYDTDKEQVRYGDGITSGGLSMLLGSPNGGFQADIGGNARGTSAIDLQQNRANATEVASGDYSIASGGYNNTASGYCSTVSGFSNTASGICSTVSGGSGNEASSFCSTVSGGGSNEASGDNSAVGGGEDNEASGEYSTVSGGRSNEASGSYAPTVSGGRSNIASGYCSTVSGGRNNTASGYYSTVSGGSRAVASQYGQRAYAAGRFADSGDAQENTFVLRKSITHSTADWGDLALDGITTYLSVPTDTVMTFSCLITGTTQGCTKSFGFEIKGVVENDGGTTSILASTVTTLYDTDDTDFDAQAVAAGTDLRIQVQDASSGGDTVRWFATLTAASVTYAA